MLNIAIVGGCALLIGGASSNALIKYTFRLTRERIYNTHEFSTSTIEVPPDPNEWSTIGVVCVMAVLFMGLMTPRVANILAGYEVETLRAQQQQLLDESRRLDLEEAALVSRKRLEHTRDLLETKRSKLARPAAALVKPK
jgi:cell division protein FtsL